jgi:lipopolysaccharide transport system permease protein
MERAARISGASAELKIVDSKSTAKSYFADIIEYRELLGFMALRDIVVRYRQAFFGAAWALLKPTLTMLIFTLIFKNIASLSSGDVNYSLFVLAGMLPWQLFSGTIAETSTSLVGHANLITKVYFPRMIIPIAQMGVHIVDFMLGLVFLVILMFFWGDGNAWTVLFLPFFTLLCLMLCVGVSLWLSAAMVQYRDFRFVVPILVQLSMFISPVGYGSYYIPGNWIYLYCLNPLVGIIDGFRWALFGLHSPHFEISLAMSVSVTLLLLLSGFWYFRRMEQYFADKI